MNMDTGNVERLYWHYMARCCFHHFSHQHGGHCTSPVIVNSERLLNCLPVDLVKITAIDFPIISMPVPFSMSFAMNTLDIDLFLLDSALENELLKLVAGNLLVVIDNDDIVYAWSL